MASLLARIIISLLVVAGTPTTHAAPATCTQPLLLDMQSLTVDGDSNLVHLRGPRITQCDMKIVADEAFTTGVDFKTQSEWRFNGHVRIEVDSAVLEADSASFKFDADQLARAELIGNPASVTDMSPKRKEPVHGSADKIYYDYLGRTLRLLDNAWLYKGRNEIQGCDLIYDFNDERLTSGSSDCGVRFRVLPSPEETKQGVSDRSP